MLVGAIQTKDVLLHPLAVISLIGVRGLVKAVRLGLSAHPHTFLEQLGEILAVRPSCGHDECLAEFRRTLSEKIR